MDALNQIEIQNIRHICGMSMNCNEKLKYYKTIVTDQNLLDVFNKIEQSSTDLKTTLCNML